MLKYKTSSLADIPAEHQPLYAERDGAFILDVEGAVDKTRIDEFRENNIVLQKQINDLNKHYEGIDPAQVQALQAEKQKLEEEKLLRDGEIDKLVDSRTKSFRTDLEGKLTRSETGREQLLRELTDIKITQAAIIAATKHKLRDTAIPDLAQRARNTFRLHEGSPIAFEADGKTARLGKDGSSALTLEEWAESLVAEAPHLFEESTGGGAAGVQGSGGAEYGRNPWSKDTWNLTEQGRIWKTNRALAERLKAAAGK